MGPVEIAGVEEIGESIAHPGQTVHRLLLSGTPTEDWIASFLDHQSRRRFDAHLQASVVVDAAEEGGLEWSIVVAGPRSTFRADRMAEIVKSIEFANRTVWLGGS